MFRKKPTPKKKSSSRHIKLIDRLTPNLQQGGGVNTALFNFFNHAALAKLKVISKPIKTQIDKEENAHFFKQLRTFILQTKNPEFPDEKTIDALHQISTKPIDASHPETTQSLDRWADTCKLLLELISKPLTDYLNKQLDKSTIAFSAEISLLLNPRYFRKKFSASIQGLLDKIQLRLDIELHNKVVYEEPLSVTERVINEMRTLLTLGADLNHIYRYKNLDLGGTVSNFQEAIIGGRTAVVELFIKHGANVNYHSRFEGIFECNLTVLMLAAKYGHTDIAKLLVTHGADVNKHFSSTNYGTVSALKLSIRGNKPNFTQCTLFLLQSGADISIRGSSNETMLHYACDNPIVIENLLELNRKHKKININAKNNYGETALMWAIQAGSPTGVKALLAGGANALLCNNDDETPLEYAKGVYQDLLTDKKEYSPEQMDEFERNHDKIVELLSLAMTQHEHKKRKRKAP